MEMSALIQKYLLLINVVDGFTRDSKINYPKIFMSR